MLSQRWSTFRDNQSEIRRDSAKRGRWQRKIDEINLVVEEVTWQFRFSDKDEFEEGYGNGKEEEESGE